MYGKVMGKYASEPELLIPLVLEHVFVSWVCVCVCMCFLAGQWSSAASARWSDTSCSTRSTTRAFCFNGDGDLDADMLDMADKAAFLERTECIEAIYSNFSLSPGIPVRFPVFGIQFSYKVFFLVKYFLLYKHVL